MKFLFCFTLVLLLPSLSHAADLDDQINKACLRHAVSLVAQLKSDVIDSLSQNQSDQALKIATETCQAYFKKEFSEKTITSSTSDDTGDEDSDWFTDKILNSEVERKAGNERLMKKR